MFWKGFLQTVCSQEKHTDISGRVKANRKEVEEEDQEGDQQQGSLWRSVSPAGGPVWQWPITTFRWEPLMLG